jgi:acyl-[acyl-carrier-protein]-phospholipid O-acyltransferase/long-chain-fatty-acid--[acyl-carrier-protein] ligase
MMGYLKNKEKTDEVIQDGWYNTGDVARVDHDGFVFLLDRITRYSKIGGEMVPHVAIEEKLLEQVKSMDQEVFVSSAPDERKGEQIIVLFTEGAGTAEELQKVIHDSDLPNLWKPKKENYLLIDKIPTLGSGKIDQKHLKEIARSFVDNRPGMMQKMINKIRETL